MRRLLLIVLAVSATACASAGRLPAPAAAGVAPTPDVVPRGSRAGIQLVATALTLRGVPYRNGGADPRGFDCSGFVRYVFTQHGRSLPREVREQFRAGRGVRRNRLAAGDLVFFTTVAPGASHVGIATGDGRFVHAPSERGVVRIEPLDSKYWSSRYVGAKRIG